jgi:hypothetical protein
LYAKTLSVRRVKIPVFEKPRMLTGRFIDAWHAEFSGERGRSQVHLRKQC